MTQEERTFWTEVFLHFMRKAGGNTELAEKEANKALESMRKASHYRHDDCNLQVER